MFIFKLNILGESSFNYPKYTIVLKSLNVYYFHDNSMFYYLVSAIKNYIGIPNKTPKYLIALDLYIDRYKENEKFDLSKLGTDYIFNKINMYFKYDCKGSYPENYVFVIEPSWPIREKDITDRTPLKHSYRSKA